MSVKKIVTTTPVGSTLASLVSYGKKLSSTPKHTETNTNFINFVLSLPRSEQLLPEFLNLVLSNLQLGLEASPTNNVRKLAKKSLAVYAQLAEHAGMHQVRAELEDLAFQILMPVEFDLVTQQMNKIEGLAVQQMGQLKQSLKHILEQACVEYIEIKGRKKHAYSVYQKLAKSITISEIYDLVALRVLVSEINDCYESLNAIHDRWPPLVSRIKDYIAQPKNNGYQSLHTTVRADSERLVEIQIRTPEMHTVAEKGLAAHYLYNQSKTSKHYKTGDNFQYKLQKMRKRVYVFTPTGDVFALAPGSVVLDFAFALHTNIGLRARGAEINGKITRLDTVLQNGDTLKILTQKSAKPKPDWLAVVKSSKARNRIRGWLRATLHDSYADIGKSILNKSAILAENHLQLIDLLDLLKYQDPDDLYVALGSGLINVEQIKSKLNTKFSSKPRPTKQKQIQSVIIGGMKGLHYQLASCCAPAMGDAIVGFTLQAHGVSIHSTSCRNLPKQTERWLDCTWE